MLILKAWEVSRYCYSLARANPKLKELSFMDSSSPIASDSEQPEKLSSRMAAQSTRKKHRPHNKTSRASI